MQPIEINYQGKKYGGFKICPKWLKDSFRKAVNYKCQDCNKHEDEVGTLEIHRCIRGKEGGLYVCVSLNHPLNNCNVLCSQCHDRYDYGRQFGNY